jgi:hypothetical protein
MISGRLFYPILAISLCGLFAAVLAPGSLKPAGRSWQFMVCTAKHCPSGWPTAVVGLGHSNSLEPVRQNRPHKA